MSVPSDQSARSYAVDPSRNVLLEASAGTGKTRVLVERYVNLLRAGVDPDHILAITFTRKAAAEMRERIVDRLREASRTSELDRVRWRDLKNRLGDIAISTIDAFCLALLREFPLEADVDPGFDLADDAEAPRLVAEALDFALRICRRLARDEDDVALVFAQLGERRLRTGLAALLERRLVAPRALRRFLAQGPRDLTAAVACRTAAERIRAVLLSLPAGVRPFLEDGPRHHPQFAMLAEDVLRWIDAEPPLDFTTRERQAACRDLIDRLRGYFLTQDGRPRGERFAGTPFKAADCDSDAAWRRHRTAAASIAPAIAEALAAFKRDLNVVLARGVWRIYGVTLAQYHKALESRALLDFSGVLERALKLLRDMDEFAQSRFQLESRFRHVLVDEFQDTSRAQWELVSQLVRTWGEGAGASDDALRSSIFVVGDRKQSIYGFRDAEVAVLEDAAGFIAGLRGEDDVRRAISVSFRSVPEILALVNDLCGGVEKRPERRDAFRYGDADRFPLAVRGEDDAAPSSRAPLLPFDAVEPPLGLIAADSVSAVAERVGAEIARLLAGASVRDRQSGMRRPVRPSDVAVLMRSRDTHREFEKALERRGVPAHVYKGLGFFEAAEVQDVVALLRYLADPQSQLRTAVFLRSRIVRMSDAAIAVLAPELSGAVLGDTDRSRELSEDDARVLTRLRSDVPRWLALVDRATPAEIMREVLNEAAYAVELDGPRRRQARENLKKLAAMVRRFQNRGYATLARVAEHLDELAVGDESNAALDATESVSLMTVHAAKGLEFPVVFVVNLHRGTGNARAPIRVVADVEGEPSVAIADYQSEADEDAVARDREETKRLLYVALTRARDRLYLCGVVGESGFRPTRGSLGEVLPATFREALVRALTVSGSVRWQADGGEHVFAVP